MGDSSFDAVVVGAGIAGAAAGFGLARRGLDVLVIERETVAGVHSTGRNAAILRHGFGPPSDLRLASGTRRLLAIGELGPIDFRRCGSLHTASGEQGMRLLEREAAALTAADVPARVVTAEEARRRVPILEHARIDAALLTPDDGVLDVHALHQSLLAGVRAVGGRIELARTVRRILTDDAGVCGVLTDDGTRTASLVVDAAGAWSNELAATAGARRLDLSPRRRHLLQTEPDASIDPAWAVVWDVSAQVYLRPESGGLLLCPCDEDPLPACDCRVDARTVEAGVVKLVRHLPRLADLRISRSWAGLRTLTPDGACAVGFDPDVDGLFRVVGLGGHGVSAAGGLLEVIPELALDGGTDRLDAREISPGRLVLH